VLCNTSCRWVLKTKKKAYPSFHSHCENFPGCSPVKLQHVSTAAVSPISHWCSSAQIIRARRTLRHRPIRGDTRSRYLTSGIISTIFFMVFSAGPGSTTSVIKGPQKCSQSAKKKEKTHDTGCYARFPVAIAIYYERLLPKGPFSEGLSS